jgi:hypothetical protein
MRAASHVGLDLAARHLGEPQAERHVLEDGHVRVQRVRLEHHRDAALRRRQVIDALSADPQLVPLLPGPPAAARRPPVPSLSQLVVFLVL